MDGKEGHGDGVEAVVFHLRLIDRFFD